MFGLALEWETCPDGVEALHYRGGELVGHDESESATEFEFLDATRLPPGTEIPRPTVVFRPRSDRRRSVSYVMSSLEDLVALRFVNAARRHPDGPGAPGYRSPSLSRAGFLSRFGMLRRKGETSREELNRDWNLVNTCLRAAGGGDRTNAVATINSVLGGHLDWQKVQPPYPVEALRLIPSIELSEAGAPRLALQPESLIDFMLMESAMVAAHGARFAECEHCSSAFLTGPTTGRRSHAKYCSDRCRVAAMRARGKAEE